MAVTELEYELGQMNLTIVKPMWIKSISVPVFVLHPYIKHRMSCKTGIYVSSLLVSENMNWYEPEDPWDREYTGQTAPHLTKTVEQDFTD